VSSIELIRAAAAPSALDERFGRLMGHSGADDRAVITSTWELSLDALAARGRPQARPLLRVLACLAPAVLIPGRKHRGGSADRCHGRARV
jgi:hypothetical protein